MSKENLTMSILFLANPVLVDLWKTGCAENTQAPESITDYLVLTT